MVDESPIDRLYRRHAPAVFAFLRQHSARREDAEDLLLEVFVTALEQTTLQEMPEQQQVAWLWRVARNKTIDSYRRAARRPALELEQVMAELAADETQSPEQSALRREEYRQLKELLTPLSPIQQDVVWLRFAYDLQCTEIAEVLGKKQSAVRVLLMRALRFLRTVYASTSSTTERL
jgi:RNA polymerase sigma factor (sigma-70 family)